MNNKKWNIPNSKPNLYVIVEGDSDYKFVERLKQLYESKYIVKIENAKSGNKIITKYKKINSIHPYTDIIVLYDLDDNKTLDDIINIYQNEEIEISKNQMYFINPFIELLFILCKERKGLKNTKKKQYQKIIKTIYDIDNYESTEEQNIKIMNQVHVEDIERLFKNIRDLISDDDKQLPSTNFPDFFDFIFKK